MLLSVIQLAVPLAFVPLAHSYRLLAERATLITDSSQLRSAYDYVVIGGGTSGLTVANRLTENEKSTFNDGGLPIEQLLLTGDCVGQSRYS